MAQPRTSYGVPFAPKGWAGGAPVSVPGFGTPRMRQPNALVPGNATLGPMPNPNRYDDNPLDLKAIAANPILYNQGPNTSTHPAATVLVDRLVKKPVTATAGAGYSGPPIYSSLGAEQTRDRANKIYQTFLAEMQGDLSNPAKHQKLLDLAALLANGPQLYQNIDQLAADQAGLQYNGGITDAQNAQQLGLRQGKQNSADIAKWYARVNTAMQAARDSNGANTQALQNFSNDSSAGLMAAMGGGANTAVGATAPQVSDNNNQLGTLGQIQANFLQNRQLDANQEGAQQGTNQLRLNSTADAAALANITKLQNQKDLATSDNLHVLQGDNNNILAQQQAIRTATAASNNAARAANNLQDANTRKSIYDAGKENVIANQSVTEDQRWVKQANYKTQQDLAEQGRAIAQQDLNNKVALMTKANLWGQGAKQMWFKGASAIGELEGQKTKTAAKEFVDINLSLFSDPAWGNNANTLRKMLHKLIDGAPNLK